MSNDWLRPGLYGVFYFAVPATVFPAGDNGTWETDYSKALPTTPTSYILRMYVWAYTVVI